MPAHRMSGLIGAIIGILLGLVLFFGTGCAGIQEGDTSHTLQEAAALPVPPPKASEPPVQRFDPAQGTLTGYRPRKVLPNGDAAGGHFVDITLTTTVDEIITPSTHIPRAPKTVPVTQPSSKIRQPKPPPVETPPATPPPADVPAALLPLLPPQPSATPGVSINPHTGALNGVVVPAR